MAFTPSPTPNRDPYDLTPGHRVIPTFGYPGGKTRLRKRICALLPPTGVRFIEPFAGRMAVTLAVSQLLNYKRFWLNDLQTYNFLLALKWADDIPPDIYRQYWRAVEEAKHRPPDINNTAPAAERGKFSRQIYQRLKAAKLRGDDTEWISEEGFTLAGNPLITRTNVHKVEPLHCFSGGMYENSGQKSRLHRGGPNQIGYWRSCCRAGDIMRQLHMRVTHWDYKKVLEQLGHIVWA